jgi:hypothetical protein
VLDGEQVGGNQAQQGAPCGLALRTHADSRTTRNSSSAGISPRRLPLSPEDAVTKRARELHPDLPEHEAVARFLGTPEGERLYAQTV